MHEKETDSDEDFQLETDKEESETGNHTDCAGSNTPSSSSPGGSRRARGGSRRARRGSGRGRRGSSRGRSAARRSRSGFHRGLARASKIRSKKATPSEFSWSNKILNNNNNADQIFAEVPGPKRLPTSVKEPIDYFLLFFNMQLVTLIVNQTNLHYKQIYAANASLNPFPEVCEEEILAYFGIIIAMGIYKLPKLSNYWRRTGIGAMPWFRTVFSKNRFFAISKYLHANDKTKRPEQGQDGYKLFHVQLIIYSLL